ncbi:MAG: hypothetical protein C4547_06635 [Phycisphaerales bacterium]|nr:MAG: hypothetical protein C4547_06635 [Phycisphaerales bacterium]
MSALDRVKTDIERGDFGMARIRLMSYLDTQGYDPEVLNRLGQLCLDMHDPFEAGRFWLASSARGEDVDAAISVFLDRVGGGPWHVVSQLPRGVRLASLESYPDAAADRLRQFGLQEAILLGGKGVRTKPPSGGTTRSGTVAGIAFVTVGLAIFCAGLWSTASWLLRLLTGD